MALAELIIRAIDWFYIRPVAAVLPRQVFRYAVCGVWPTPAKMVTTLLTTVYSFLAAKYFTFRHAEKPE